MNESPGDRRARERFRDEWAANFAVTANAGSGKTTAISERLAALALAPGGAGLLRQTAVVTFTKKAAAQIGQRARQSLMRRLGETPGSGFAPLDHLERAFFGTIHSFCLLLAQRYGQALGLNLNPAVVVDEDDDLWEEFLEQDAMQFAALASPQIDGYLRHAPLDSIFALARRLDAPRARQLLARAAVAARPPGPSAEALRDIQAARAARGGRGAEGLRRNQEAAAAWARQFGEESGYLPIPKPEGSAAGIKELYARCFAPLKAWLAEAGAVLAAELALRYRAWRFDRGVQTYADQVEAAVAMLEDAPTLDRIRADGWRVILDEAQDTDPQQFAVLVEIARPVGAPAGTWPAARGPGPRPGHFCMVGDGQQAIYGNRADIGNFQRHLEAFRRGDGGELLAFDVTFRAPHRVIALLNGTLAAAFGSERGHNLGFAPSGGGEPPLLQVPYGALVAGPENAEGSVGVLTLAAAESAAPGVDGRLAAEVRQLAARLRDGGPAAVGARAWGEICVLAPRNSWLVTARKELEAAGLKTALQMRKNRNGDNPAYAWMCGLLAALCDPENPFEWTGVLREVFAVSDRQIAEALRREKRFHWDDPERYDGALRHAVAALKPFVERVDAEGEPLERFAVELAGTGALAAKARLIDPTGALAGELDRLLARAAELGLAGGGPRAWRRELLAEREDGRPAGKPSSDAINLLTGHSAKGLEWPVVIPIGLWRPLRKRPDTGLHLLAESSGPGRVFFDHESLPDETQEARERERLREHARLLYVMLTRPRRVLALPWGADFAEAEKGSLAHLWGADLPGVPALEAEPPVAEPAPAEPPAAAVVPASAIPIPASAAFPPRFLPHQLARHPDLVRAARHEAALEEPPPARTAEDPLEYGTWWHQTMEFLPWGDEAAWARHAARALEAAETQGFRPRGEEEWKRLRASPAWAELGGGSWTRFAELGIFAPWRDGWIDGVIDLVLHDAAGKRLWIVDWKTNRRRPAETDAALLARLAEEYEPQLSAYGACVGPLFPGCAVRLLVYSTVAGAWTDVN